jgi:hypothetical protein
MDCGAISIRSISSTSTGSGNSTSSSTSSSTSTITATSTSSSNSTSISHDDGGVCAVISSHWDFQSFYSFPLDDLEYQQAESVAKIAVISWMDSQR